MLRALLRWARTAHLLDKETPSSSFWQRHRCELIAAAAVILLGAAFMVHRSSGRSTYLVQEKPQSDRRTYQYSVLPNGLPLLNIQDAESHKMAMAMAVRAGSYDDPHELPGLAHFCEHMLFLGTNKYPEPSGFDNFLTKYGGASNAYTASEVTVYFASAGADAAPEGLDRFADFFRAPLFKKEFVKKEVQAINSEHEKNVQSNLRRIFELLESQANPDSVVGRFATGNMETLYSAPTRNGTSPVDALKGYFKQRYCPEQMRLVTFGPQPLAEQMKLVTKAGFGELDPGAASCAQDKRRFPEPQPFPRSFMGKHLLVEGTEATGALWLHFQLPSLSREHAAQPLTYLNYVIDYGGENSLKRVLSDSLGLVSNVQLEEQTDSTGTMFMVVFSTTELGFNHSQAILDVFFSYLAGLSAGADMNLYKSIQDMVKLQWDWKQQDDAFGTTVSNLAEVMTRLPHEKLLSGDSLIEKPDAQLMSSLIQLVEPGNMNIAAVAPSALGEEPLKATKKPIRTLQYYGAKYVEQTMDEVLPGASKRWSTWLQGMDKPQLAQQLRERLNAEQLLTKAEGLVLPPQLPTAIEGIPSHVSLDHMTTRSATTGLRAGLQPPESEQIYGPLPVRMSLDIRLSSKPVVLLADPQNQTKEDVWYRPGWTMRDPQVHIVVGLRTLQREKEPEVTAFDWVRLQVYEKLLGEAMAPKMYNMLAAGSKYVVSTSTNGITITFVGYQEAMSKLINRTLNVFNSFNEHLNTTLPSRFHRIAKTYREELETFGGMPSSYAIQDMERLLMRNRFSNHESLEALSKINLTAAARAGGDLLLSKELKMTALAIGNLADLESTDALHEIASSLARPSWTVAQPSPVDGRVEEVQPVVNVQKPVEVRTLNPRPGDPNDVAVVSLVYGVGDVPSRVILSIASSLLGTAAFDHLRTQQQLGPFLSPRTVVQGTKVSADEAEAAIEGLLTTTMPKILRELTVEDFQSQVDAYRQQLLEPPLAASDEVSHFWGHITQGGRCMNLLDKALSFLKSPQCNKQMLIDTWNDLAFGNVKDGKNALRKKISVKYFAQKDGSDTAPKRPTLQEARAAWQKHGVPPAATELLEREWSETKTVAASNSKVRQELAEDGGFFPTDLHCGGEAGGAEAGVVMRQAGARELGGSLLHLQGSGKSLRHQNVA
ncbi:unnamed protein product [Effrenium voratum]|nr:unnamed protein product [Effrenium voratum]